ncbi:MAG: hypothetical protein U9Q33_10335 [Campylobacterota bacterium]|nr:hypothetical protein [Campylobacterota bacterium]
MKYFISIFLCFSITYAKNSEYIPVSTKSIGWKSSIDSNDFKVHKISNKYKCKKYLDISDLKKGKYRAKHYIIKNRAICAEDVYIEIPKKVKFNFGLLEIEKSAEVVKETDNYIKIKNPNGKIEKIYKDGKVR